VKLKLTLFILCFQLVIAKAQTWCPAGATWYYSDVWPGVNGYSKYNYTTDTLINSVNCKKIAHYREGFSWSGGYYSNFVTPFYTYEQNGVAYLYNNLYGNNTFDTLFDMNAQIGDKWRFPLIDTTCADSLYFIQVLNTGTKVINGFNLKWLYVKRGPFDPNYDPNGPYLNYDFDTITERIGGCRYYDIFYSFCYGGTENDPQPCDKIRCYYDSTFGLYSTGISTSCDYYTTSVEEYELSNLNFSIYPNPATEQLNIVFSASTETVATLQIHDIVGRLIELVTIKAGESYNYNTSSLPRSVYSVSLYIDDKLAENKKLVLIK
jgi:hypothetical protein